MGQKGSKTFKRAIPRPAQSNDSNPQSQPPARRPQQEPADRNSPRTVRHEIAPDIHHHEPNLCEACINLSLIFSNPSKAQRDEIKVGVSDIRHHNKLVPLFESSRTCPLCSLIVAAIPGLVNWLLRGIPKDILTYEYECSNKGLRWDGWYTRRLSSWKQYLDGGPPGTVTEDTIQYWTQKYELQLVRLGDLGAIPSLSQVLDDLYKDFKAENVFDLANIDEWIQSIHIREDFAVKGQIAGLSLSLERGGEEGARQRVLSSGYLRVSSDPDKFTSTTVAGRPVAPQGGSQGSLELAKSWIDSCYKDHPECRWSPDSQDPPLPTRLIDVQGQGQDSIKLASPEGQPGRWAALSHRWGIGPIFSLRTETADSLQNGIPLSSLPATFQDAIQVTRFLGLKYLWIDSVCILQDSVKDWEAESAHMPGIYQNAHVVIAAGATETSHGGIFVDRAWAAKSKTCTLPVKTLNDEGSVTISLLLEHGLEHEQHNYLDSRAWCFQESRLSHRLLTFDRLQMTYTCLRHGLLESRELPHFAAREEKNSFLARLHASSSKDEKSKAREIVKTWLQAVTDYTSRALTYQNDKLVAAAGMARIIGTFTQDSYSAGLWHKTLPQSLLWSPYEEETFPNAPHKATLPSIYRAPSWSWAAIESPISNFLPRQTLDRKAHAQILSITTSLQGTDPYGQVKSGSLKIKAPMQEVTCGVASEKWPYQPNLLPLTYTPSSDKSEEDSKVGHTIFDLEWLDPGTKIWVLQITDAYGLMLLPKETGSLEVFRRIGVCHFGERVRIKNVVEVEIV